jgi:hypothetical protein
MGAGEIGVAIGGDDQQVHRFGGPHDVFEQQQLGRARPVQIIENEDDRRVL